MTGFGKSLILDRYTVMARVLPARVVALPFATIAYAWSPFDVTLAKGSLALTVFIAVGYALSHLVRDAGKRLEERLLVAWGGWPSTAVLRHRDTTFDAVTKSRFHQRAVDLGAVERMPSTSDETTDPAGADVVYSAVATWLRARTRNAKEFPLIFEENINYGYVRNALGAKWCGVGVAAFGVATDVAAGWLGRPQGWWGAAICVAVGVYLLTGVREAGLRRQSFTYAKRLIEAIDQLEAPKGVAKARGKTKTLR